MTHTLVLAYPGCIAFEVMLATELLQPRYPLEIASPDGEPLENSNGMRIDFVTAWPNAHVDFAVTVAERAGAVDAERAAQLRRYHRG